MNRWAARIIGLLMLLLFALMFVQMHKTLSMLQRESQQSR
jgi:heme A synthase